MALCRCQPTRGLPAKVEHGAPLSASTQPRRASAVAHPGLPKLTLGLRSKMRPGGKILGKKAENKPRRPNEGKPPADAPPRQQIKNHIKIVNSLSPGVPAEAPVAEAIGVLDGDAIEAPPARGPSSASADGAPAGASAAKDFRDNSRERLLLEFCCGSQSLWGQQCNVPDDRCIVVRRTEQ